MVSAFIFCPELKNLSYQLKSVRISSLSRPHDVILSSRVFSVFPGLCVAQLTMDQPSGYSKAALVTAKQNAQCKKVKSVAVVGSGWLGMCSLIYCPSGPRWLHDFGLPRSAELAKQMLGRLGSVMGRYNFRAAKCKQPIVLVKLSNQKLVN